MKYLVSSSTNETPGYSTILERPETTSMREIELDAIWFMIGKHLNGGEFDTDLLPYKPSLLEYLTLVGNPDGSVFVIGKPEDDDEIGYRVNIWSHKDFRSEEEILGFTETDEEGVEYHRKRVWITIRLIDEKKIMSIYRRWSKKDLLDAILKLHVENTRLEREVYELYDRR